MSNPPILGSGPHRYRCHDHWARIPDTPAGRLNGRTHGIVCLADGRIVVFCQAVPGLLFFNPDGELIESLGDRFVGAHGLSVTQFHGAEEFWVVDQCSCEVARLGLNGQLKQRLDHPPANERPGNAYQPTWAEQHPETGDIWVADGYGGSKVYRYSAAGDYLGRLTGEEGAGRFNCPHGLAFGPDGHLYIADRGNHRLAIYDADGTYLRHNDTATHSPCGFDFSDGLILVPELMTGVKLLDADLRIVAELGANPAVIDAADRPSAWPDLAGTEHVQPGLFNSPHDACFGPGGDLFVAEWIVGGRLTRLEKLS